MSASEQIPAEEAAIEKGSILLLSRAAGKIMKLFIVAIV
jgi:hypothetical protein